MANKKYVTGVSVYAINWNDDIINIDTSSNPVTVYLPNINNGQTNKRFYINDYNNNAGTNNITIATSGDLVNGSATLVLNSNGVTSEAIITGPGEWLVNSDLPESGSGTVTSVSWTTSQGVSASIANATIFRKSPFLAMVTKVSTKALAARARV